MADQNTFSLISKFLPGTIARDSYHPKSLTRLEPGLSLHGN